MCPLYRAQSLVYILSYSPMWDRMDICFMYVYTMVLGRHFMQLKYSNNVAYALIKSTYSDIHYLVNKTTNFSQTYSFNCLGVVPSSIVRSGVS